MSIDIASKPRKPAGVPGAGEWTARTFKEGGVALGAAPASSGLSLEDMKALVSDRNGPGAVPGFEHQLDSTTTPGGRELFLQRTDAIYNPDSAYEIDRRSYYGPTPAHCDALADLGYESVNQFAGDKLKNFGGVESVIEGRIDPERLEVLSGLSAHQFQWSDWEKDAYLNAPLDGLEAVIADKDLSRVDKYLATVDLLGDEDRSARARHAIGMKIGERGLIEADTHPLETLTELRNALPESKRNVSHIVGLADKGITGSHLKTYGANACEKFTGPELEGAPVSPKTIKSFLTSGIRPDLASMKTLEDAGYTTGADIKAASHALGTNDTKALAAARKHAAGAQLALFHGATQKNLTPADVRAVGVLGKLQVDDPAQLRPYSAAIHRAANKFIDRDQSILAIHAAIIKAKITPEQLGVMTRAGIPVTEAVKHKGTADLWAAGQPFRDTYDADQARRVASRWSREPEAWAYTEADYANPAG
ncbi:MAG TPA: hypothetical protein VF867_12550 [Arthrobacter sp.]